MCVQESVKGAVRGYSVRVVARRPGKYTVQANITVYGQNENTASSVEEYIESRRSIGGIKFKAANFQQFMEVHVMEPLELLSPHSLLLPYGSGVIPITTTLDDDSGVELTYELLTASAG